MKFAYVAPFSEKAAVSFRVREIDKIVNFEKVIFYESDNYGTSDAAVKKENVVYIPGVRRNYKFLQYAFFIITQVIKLDGVIFLKAYPANIVAALFLRLLGRKVFFDFDEMDSWTQKDIRKGFSAFASCYFWRLLERITAVVGQKFILANNRIAGLIKNKSYFYLPNSVNSADFISNGFNVEHDKNVIYAGSFHNAKEIIECLQYVDNATYNIILIGAGKELCIVHDFLSVHGYRYRSLGYLDNEALTKVFNSIRGVFLAPYRNTKRVEYSSSGKIPMYMATGCPIIVANVEGPLDFDINRNFLFKYYETCQIKDLLNDIFNKGAFSDVTHQLQIDAVINSFDYNLFREPLNRFLNY